MKQDNKKSLEVLHTSSMRDLVLKANSIGIRKEDIVQVVPAAEGFFLLYYI